MPEAIHSKGKPIPHFATDEEAEYFIDTADLSEYDLSGFKPFRLEFKAKDARINMRLPAALLSAIKVAAIKEGVPYQRLIRDLVEKGLEARAETRKPARQKAS